MGTLTVNRSLRLQLEPGHPAPSWQVETPSWGVFVWKSEGSSHPSSVLFTENPSPSLDPLGTLLGQRRKGLFLPPVTGCRVDRETQGGDWELTSSAGDQVKKRNICSP